MPSLRLAYILWLCGTKSKLKGGIAILLRLTLRHNNIAGYIDYGDWNMSPTFTE
jgi:hypothetical protein